MIIKIKDNASFDKGFFKKLEKISKMTIEEDIYCFDEIKNEDLFTYIIAKQINKIGIKKFLRTMLKDNFKEKEITKIIKSYEEKTMEFSHLEMLIKILLTLHFLNENILNLNSFFKFNMKSYIKELRHIANLQIESDGKFLEDDTDKSIENDEFINSLTQIQNKYKSNFEKKSFHLFFDKKDIKVKDEKNKILKFIKEEEIKESYNKISNPPVSINFYTLLSQILIFSPEEIILYNSLNNIDGFINNLVQLVTIFKVLGFIDLEIYNSKLDFPKI